MVGYEFESGPTPEEEARKMAHRKKIRRRIYVGILALFVLAVWLEPDLNDLHELCAALERPVIHRKVRATGYYDARGGDYCGYCWTTLKENNFDFMEFVYTPHERFSSLGPSGIYRIRKEPADSVACDSRLTRNLGSDPAATTSPEGRWCLALEPLETREARYGEYLDDIGVVDVNPLTGTVIYKRRHYFVDHETDEVIADANNYIFDKMPWLPGDLGSPTKECRLFHEELGRKDLHRELVIESTGRWTYERPADVKLNL